jgi:hypothetical protein
MTLHVSTSPNFSPTRTDVRSAFHQQRIGSDSTSPGFGARGAIAGALEPTGRGGGGVPCGTTTGAGRAGDVTGDKIDDVLLLAGDAATSLVVYPQCTSREATACQAAAASEESP